MRPTSELFVRLEHSVPRSARHSATQDSRKPTHMCVSDRFAERSFLSGWWRGRIHQNARILHFRSARAAKNRLKAESARLSSPSRSRHEDVRLVLYGPPSRTFCVALIIASCLPSGLVQASRIAFSLLIRDFIKSRVTWSFPGQKLPLRERDVFSVGRINDRIRLTTSRRKDYGRRSRFGVSSARHGLCRHDLL